MDSNRAVVEPPSEEPDPTTSDAPLTSSWLPASPAPRNGRRRAWGSPLRIGCLLVVAVFVGGPLIATAILDNVGTGGPSMQAVGFGTGGSGCKLSGSAETFPAGPPIRVVAMFSPGLEAGTTVRISTHRNGTELVGSDVVPVEEPSDCVFVGLRDLDPGHYRIEFEVESSSMPPLSGEFDITAE